MVVVQQAFGYHFVPSTTASTIQNGPDVKFMRQLSAAAEPGQVGRSAPSAKDVTSFLAAKGKVDMPPVFSRMMAALPPKDEAVDQVVETLRSTGRPPLVATAQTIKAIDERFP